MIDTLRRILPTARGPITDPGNYKQLPPIHLDLVANPLYQPQPTLRLGPRINQTARDFLNTMGLEFSQLRLCAAVALSRVVRGSENAGSDLLTSERRDASGVR